MPFSAVWLVSPATSPEPEPVKLMAVVVISGSFSVFSTVTVSAVPVSFAPGMVYWPLALVRISLPSLTV